MEINTIRCTHKHNITYRLSNESLSGFILIFAGQNYSLEHEIRLIKY